MKKEQVALTIGTASGLPSGHPVGSAISLAFEFGEFLSHFKGGKTTFDRLMDDALDNGSDPGLQVVLLQALIDKCSGDKKSALPTEVSNAIVSQMAKVIVHFCFEAARTPDLEQAWERYARAHRHFGFLEAFTWEVPEAIALSSFSRRGVNAAHAENRANKAMVFEWCDQNMHKYKSMDRAAEAVANVIVPHPFRTVRDWIGQWKKLRSPGRL